MFNTNYQSGDGLLLGLELEPLQDSDHLVYLHYEIGRKISATRAHDMMTHAGNQTCDRTAKRYGWNLFEKEKCKCRWCAIGKARQANLNKITIPRINVRGGRFFFDMSSIRMKEEYDNKFWLLFLDDSTDCPFPFILDRKGDLSDTAIPFFQDLRARHGITVKILRWMMLERTTNSRKTVKGQVWE